MALLPLSGLLIAAGLALFSVLVVNRIKGAGLFGRSSRLALSCICVFLLALGLVLHLKVPPEGVALSARSRQTVVFPVTSQTSRWSFSFEPKTVRWGEDVRLRVTPTIEKIEVYLNGNPLPSRTIGPGAFVVTIPTISRSGYFTLDCAGTKVRATEELIVSAR